MLKEDSMRRGLSVLVIVIVASLVLAIPAAAAPATAGGPGYHRVRVGETLSSIGRLYGVSPWTIAQANHLADPNRIYIGQWLWIPGYPGYPGYPGHPVPPPPGRYHTVMPGQTLFAIGRLYGLNPWVIASANGIYNTNLIYTGQRLIIPYYP
jgi:LysM repeat protein